MKHLKLFESFKSNLFFEIDLSSFNQYVEDYQKRVFFNEKMIKNISDILKEFDFENIKYYGGEPTRQIAATKPHESTHSLFPELFDKFELNIFCIQDEWFLVRVREWGKGQLDSYYKCDQLEGLQELISQL